MKVSEFIELLQTFNPDLPVGVTDYYGVFILIEKAFLPPASVRKSRVNGEKQDVLEVSVPYIGEEPD